jgi:uncharacterized membrane protein YhiD involved in acid resistance
MEDISLSTQNIDISLYNFGIGIFLSIFLGFLVQQFYIKFSTTLSNRREFSKIFLILAATTTIIITIVKSSLALSLGLVGALSIVRFRAAIKEPEELVYLFLIITIGIGCGAGQFIITTLGIIIILLFILFYSRIETEKIKNLEKLSLSVICDYNLSEEEIEKISDLLTQQCEYLELISLVKHDKNSTINYKVQFKNFSDLNKLLTKVQRKNIKVVVAQT